MVVSKRTKVEAKPKPRKVGPVIGGVIDLVSKEKNWTWENTMGGSYASYATNQSKGDDGNSDDDRHSTSINDDLKQVTTETPNDDSSSDDENKKIKAKPVPMVASKETQLANMDSNNNTTVEDSANAVPNEEMLAQALQGKIVALSRAQDESGIRRLLSMITNTIVTTGVASLEPVIPDMRVVYKGTTKMKDGTPDETVEKKTDE